jgi:large subunit ribosomal protein L28
MPRVCQQSGKRARAGRQYTTRGKAKSEGGVGKKITGKTNRMFRPNVQRIRAVVDGKVVRLTVAAKFVRRGMVTKPLRRDANRPAAPDAPPAS